VYRLSNESVLGGKRAWGWGFWGGAWRGVLPRDPEKEGRAHTWKFKAKKGVNTDAFREEGIGQGGASRKLIVKILARDSVRS